MNHYIYKLTTKSLDERELYYIGVRSSKCTPVLDTNYMSSSRIVDHMMSMQIPFEKEILDTYETREQAEAAEQMYFDLDESITNINCLNLNSHNTPYASDKGAIKMNYFKELFPELNSTYVPNNSKGVITHKDIAFRVSTYEPWMFINHPDHLKYYWASTGTLSYWPGREDMLMTNKMGKKKFYLTRFDLVDGTPLERIQQFYESHYISGQKTPVVEVIEQLMGLLNLEDWLVARALLTKHSSDMSWIFPRIDKKKPK